MTEAAALRPDAEFDAFISYSHKRDRDLARSLERTLWTFGRKWFEIRKLKTYRDETNLSAEPDLWSKIEDAVKRSRHLVLLASPESAKSTWVPKEVQAAIATHGVSSLCIVQTAGVLPWTDNVSREEMLTRDDASMSASVLGQLAAAAAIPLVIDLRPYRAMRDAERERNPEYLSLVAAIAAKLLGVDKEAIWGSYYHAQRVRTGILAISVAVLLALLIGLAGLYRSTVLEAALAASRATAADARLQVNQELRQALSGSAAAYDLSPSIDAQIALLESLNRASHVMGFYPCPLGQKNGYVTFSDQAPYTMAFSCLGSEERSITVVSADGTKIDRVAIDKEVRALAFIDPHTLAIDGATSLRVIDTESGVITSYPAAPSLPDSQKISVLAAAPRRGLIFSSSGSGAITSWQRTASSGPWSSHALIQIDGSIRELSWSETDGKLRATRYDGSSKLVAVSPDGNAVVDSADYPAPDDTRCAGHPISGRMGTTAQATEGPTFVYNTEENEVVVGSGTEPCDLYYGNTHNFALAISADGQRIASVGAIEDGDNVHGAILWNTAQVHPLATRLHAGNSALMLSPILALSADGSSWACATCDDGVLLWDGAVAQLPAGASTDDLTSLGFSSDGSELAAGFKDGSFARLRKNRTGDRKGGPTKAPVKQVWFGARTMYLAYGDGSVWRAKTEGAGFEVLLSAHDTSGYCLDTHFSGDRIAFEAREGSISLVDLSSGRRAEIELPSDAGSCSGIAFSPQTRNGIRLPSGYGRFFVLEPNLLSTTVGGWINPLHDPSGLSKALFKPRLSDQGTRLVALDGANTVFLFDPAERRAIGSLRAGEVRDLVLSADGKRLLTYSQNDGLLLWDIDAANWPAIAAKLVNNSLVAYQGKPSTTENQMPSVQDRRP